MSTVTFFGVRGSCPVSGVEYTRYGGNTSCILVEVDANTPPIILDLGTGLRPLGEYLDTYNGNLLKNSNSAAPARSGSNGSGSNSTEPNDIRAVAFVTHLHWDHIQGLPFFPQANRARNILDIYGPAQEERSMLDAYHRFMSPPFFPVGVWDLESSIRLHGLRPGDKLNVGSATVTAFKVPHTGGLTLGYRIEIGEHSLAFISDHQAPLGWEDGALDAEVLSNIRGVDLLIHDAQFTPEEFELKSDWGHSTVDYAVMVAGQAGVKHLALYHHDPAHKDSDMDAILQEARSLSTIASTYVFAAQERQVIDLNDLDGSKSDDTKQVGRNFT